ncbi:STAS domain-containing protein [Oceanobacillus sp. 143]|uniref:STAS domain-containing protein n=1 Tax=Oceanobacillus zhaokaii TaxID=2052660 RepID=A0A345PD10_9BACI|nr:STAS domain-containing protein [Oceanobacillus zhaokaii]AXI07890.1 hypothetical protein CUC15_02360 [Oceanobacillus zhaokaii]QGS67963.1 STAS domain-containing protein [Oceanobacillus sp. 143]
MEHKGDSEKKHNIVVNKLREINIEIYDEVKSYYQDTIELNVVIDELVELVSQGLESKEFIGPAELLGVKIGKMTLKNDMKLDTAIEQITDVRRLFWQKIRSIVLVSELSIDTVLAISDVFNPVFDRIIYAVSTMHNKSFKESFERQEEELLRLSAPVVPIIDGFAVLPIVGEMTEKRSELLMRTVLQEATAQELEYLFIDLSGAMIIDTLIANNLFKIVDTLELVGIKTILSGIRPEVSQTMVSLGVNFNRIEKYNTLRHALSSYVTINK